MIHLNSAFVEKVVLPSDTTFVQRHFFRRPNDDWLGQRRTRGQQKGRVVNPWGRAPNNFGNGFFRIDQELLESLGGLRKKHVFSNPAQFYHGGCDADEEFVWQHRNRIQRRWMGQYLPILLLLLLFQLMNHRVGTILLRGTSRWSRSQTFWYYLLEINLKDHIVRIPRSMLHIFACCQVRW